MTNTTGCSSVDTLETEVKEARDDKYSGGCSTIHIQNMKVHKADGQMKNGEIVWQSVNNLQNTC